MPPGAYRQRPSDAVGVAPGMTMNAVYWAGGRVVGALGMWCVVHVVWGGFFGGGEW